MGSIEPHSTAAGRRYRVRYRKPGRTQSDKRGFRTKREAELFLASVEVAKARGSYVDPTLARVTVSDWMDLWLGSRRDLRATTRTRVVGIVKMHVLPGPPESVCKIVNVISGARTARTWVMGCW